MSVYMHVYIQFIICSRSFKKLILIKILIKIKMKILFTRAVPYLLVLLLFKKDSKVVDRWTDRDIDTTIYIIHYNI